MINKKKSDELGPIIYRAIFFGRDAIPDSLAFDLNLSFIRKLDQFVELIFFLLFIYKRDCQARKHDN